jgi:hypothetical protein
MKSKFSFILRGISLVFLLSLIQVSETSAQCPMCRITLESNYKNGGTQGKGMNTGILYLLVTPYLLVGGIAFVWYRNRKRKEDIEIEEQLATIG